MHAYMNQYSRIRGSGRIQYACHRSSRKKTAESRMWKKNEISLQKSMEFLFQSHLKLTSAEKDYIISQVATSLMEWRVEPTVSGATAVTIAYIIMMTDRMKKNMEQLSKDRMKMDMEESHTGLIKASW